MDDTLKLFRQAYRSTHSYAGNFHSFPEILQAFNNLLSADYSGELSADELREAVKACYPRAAFNPEFTDRMSGNTFEAVRIFFSKAEAMSDRADEPAKPQHPHAYSPRPQRYEPRYDQRPYRPNTNQGRGFIYNLRNDVRRALAKAFPDSDGTYLMTAVVPALRRSGIDIKSMGYPTLKDFLSRTFEGRYNMFDVGSEGHPKLLLRLDGDDRGRNGDDRRPNPTRTYRTGAADPDVHDRAFSRIKRFALVFSFKQLIRRLAHKALPEQWYYGPKDPGTWPVLNSYFLQTFDRLCEQDEQHADDPEWSPRLVIRKANGELTVRRKQDDYLPEEMAVFNTGLIDRDYYPIYAVFYTNPEQGEEKSPWVFYNFVSESDANDYARLVRVYGEQLPMPVHYYDSTAELVFDVRKPVIDFNWEHIIERVDRLPHAVLADLLAVGGRSFEGTPEQIDAAIADLRNDEAAMTMLRDRITAATERSLRRARWDYHTVVPVYHAHLGRISMLLPLALVEPRTIDTVLVMEVAENAYIPHTIYTPEMAYRSARLLGRPDIEWLAPRHIRPSVWLHAENAVTTRPEEQIEEHDSYNDLYGYDDNNVPDDEEVDGDIESYNYDDPDADAPELDETTTESPEA